MRFFGNGDDQGSIGAIIQEPRYLDSNDGAPILGEKKKSRFGLSKLAKTFNPRAMGRAAGNFLSVAKDEVAASVPALIRTATFQGTAEDKAQALKAVKFIATNVTTAAVSATVKSALVGTAVLGSSALATAALAVGAGAAVGAGIKTARIVGRNWAQNRHEAPENKVKLFSWKRDWKEVGTAALWGTASGIVGVGAHSMAGSPSWETLKNWVGLGHADTETVAQAVAAGSTVKAAGATSVTEAPVSAPEPVAAPVEAPAPVETAAPSQGGAVDVAEVAEPVPTLGASEAMQMKTQAMELYQNAGSQEELGQAVRLYERVIDEAPHGSAAYRQAVRDLAFIKTTDGYQSLAETPVSPSSLDTSSVADTAGDTATDTGTAVHVAEPVEAPAPVEPRLVGTCTSQFTQIEGMANPRMETVCDVSPDTMVGTDEALGMVAINDNGDILEAQRAVNGGDPRTVRSFLQEDINPNDDLKAPVYNLYDRVVGRFFRPAFASIAP